MLKGIYNPSLSLFNYKYRYSDTLSWLMVWGDYAPALSDPIECIVAQPTGKGIIDGYVVNVTPMILGSTEEHDEIFWSE
jgi:hypothetical protein